MCTRGRERDRDRETETHTHTGTDTQRQTDRQTGRERERGRQTDRDSDSVGVEGKESVVNLPVDCPQAPTRRDKHGPLSQASDCRPDLTTKEVGMGTICGAGTTMGVFGGLPATTCHTTLRVSRPLHPLKVCRILLLTPLFPPPLPPPPQPLSSWRRGWGRKTHTHTHTHTNKQHQNILHTCTHKHTLPLTPARSE